jgi:hypothetical protein
MNIQTVLFAFILSLVLSACTTANIGSSPTPNTTSLPTPTAVATILPTPTPTSSPSPSPTVQKTTKPSATIKEGNSSVNIDLKNDVRGASTTNVNSNTNVNITSNGTNVKITSKNGKRYAELNGKEVELDSNGCYDFNQGGTKIHSCVGN